MKKIWIVLLCIILVFTFCVGCDTVDTPNQNGDSAGNTDNNGGSTDNNGGSTDNNGGSTDNNGGSTGNNGNTDSNGGNIDGGGSGEDGNTNIPMMDYLRALLSGYKANPYAFIPETMRPDYSANLIAPSDIVTDYSSFVNTSDIESGGFGEQWNMIITNIQQSAVFFQALNAVESIASTSITIFNNYIDKNPADTAHHSFASGIYSVTIDFDGDVLYYVLDYTATLPVVGEQTVQIALKMDVESGEKTVRVQLGDANALTYTVSDSSYTFAIRYLGVRRAYFSIERQQNGTVTGHIYEYLTVSSVEIASAADFYITEDYVSAVGNKADGIIGFKNYINELYDAKTGKLLGYEVRETLSSITYNTLFFNLSDISGIQSIKYRAALEETPAAFFVNGLSAEWQAKKVGGFSLKTASRRFDIEFRTQYFYSYDAANDQYVQIQAQVPMLFVQEENYSTLVNDIKSTNNVTVSVQTRAIDLAKLQADYDTLIDVFIANKEVVTVDAILSFIGSKIELN